MLVLREGKVTNYELTARRKDGHQTVVSYNAATFYDRNGKLQGVFVTLDAERDTAELLKAYMASFDPSFVAWVVYMKFVLFVPLDRIHKALLRQNANISWSALVYLIERAADLLGPIDGCT